MGHDQSRDERRRRRKRLALIALRLLLWVAALATVYALFTIFDGFFLREGLAPIALCIAYALLTIIDWLFMRGELESERKRGKARYGAATEADGWFEPNKYTDDGPF